MSKRECKDCTYFEIVCPDVIPTLHWEGEIQTMKVIESEHEGKCTHERNWKPSRGDMPCDYDFSCNMFEPVGVNK